MEKNVLNFPKSVNHLPNSAEEAAKTLIEGRTILCDEVTNEIFQSIIDRAQLYGLLSDETKLNVKDLLMMEEVVKSSLYRNAGLEHPFHEMIDEMFTIEGIDDIEPVEPTDEELKEIENTI